MLYGVSALGTFLCNVYATNNGFAGIFTLLTLICFFILRSVFKFHRLCARSTDFRVHSTSKQQAKPTKLLLALTLFALWASTTAFLVLNTLFAQYLILRDAYITWSDSSTSAAYDDDAVLSYLQAGACGGTATLTINVKPSVRASATVYTNSSRFIDIAGRRHRVVARVRTLARQPADPRSLRPSLARNLRYVPHWQPHPRRFPADYIFTYIYIHCVPLRAHIAMGVVDTCWSCYRSDGSWRPDPRAAGIGYIYQGFSYGVAATALSLATNVLATVLVAYKPWQVSPMPMRTLAVSKFKPLTSRYARR